MARGYIKSRAKGSHTIWVPMGKGPDGKRKRHTETFHGTKAQAEARKAELIAQIAGGTFIEPSRMTTAEFFRLWLKKHAARHCTTRTAERYAYVLENVAAPVMGHIPLAKLQPLHIEGFMEHLQTAPRRDGRPGPLAPRTLLHYHRIIDNALGRAVEWKLIPYNPAAGVREPKVRKAKHRAATYEEIIRLLQEVDGTSLHLPVFLAVGTGMRRGEVCGLRWVDVRLWQENGIWKGCIRVEEAIEVSRKHGTRAKPPKTEESQRPIPLPEFVVAALIQAKGRQAAEQLLQGDKYQDSGRVCRWPDGTAMHPDRVTRGFIRLTARLGLTGLRYHDLRHTFASVLRKEGADLQTISELLGHKDQRTTQMIYSHLFEGEKESAVDRLGAAVKRAGS